MWCFKLLLLRHNILSILDVHPILGVGSAGWEDSLHSGGVLCLDSDQRLWRTEGRMDLAVLVLGWQKPSLSLSDAL